LKKQGSRIQGAKGSRVAGVKDLPTGRGSKGSRKRQHRKDKLKTKINKEYFDGCLENV
jgi:hypothetical protein